MCRYELNHPASLNALLLPPDSVNVSVLSSDAGAGGVGLASYPGSPLILAGGAW